MAANFNLLKLDRLLPRRDFESSADGLAEANLQLAEPFISERGMILIGCFVFCALVWSTALLWIFG